MQSRVQGLTKELTNEKYLLLAFVWQNEENSNLFHAIEPYFPFFLMEPHCLTLVIFVVRWGREREMEYREKKKRHRGIFLNWFPLGSVDVLLCQ